MQIVFFAESPKIQVGIGKDPMTRLLFEGVESCQGAHVCISSARLKEENGSRVPDTPEEPPISGTVFTEDTWFSKGKGLIALEQKVKGKLR